MTGPPGIWDPGPPAPKTRAIKTNVATILWGNASCTQA